MDIRRLLKKEKTYELTPKGRMQMEFDKTKEKQAKIAGVVGVTVLVAFTAAGVMSQEFLTMMLVSKGLSKVANTILG